MDCIYLDHNATTPLNAHIRGHLEDWMKVWGNPSSNHIFGRSIKSYLRQSRLKIADLIGAKPLEVVFTSGGSESNNQVVQGVYFHNQKYHPTKNHFLVGGGEHPSTLKAFEFIASLGAKVDTIPVDYKGRVDLEAFRESIRPETALISFMLAQNETGHIYPIKKMAKIAHQKGVLFHSDCVQGLGKMPLSVADLGVDFASFSAHKFYALKGCGVTYIKTGQTLSSLIHGGRQERSRRAGTEHTLGIIALASMAEQKSKIEQVVPKMRTIRDSMEEKLAHIEGIRILQEGQRLCNTSNFIVDGIDGESLLINLDLVGFAVSTGAACSSGSQESSPTLRSLGLTRQEARQSLRISLGWDSTQKDVDQFCLALEKILHRLRRPFHKEASSQQLSSRYQTQRRYDDLRL